MKVKTIESMEFCKKVGKIRKIDREERKCKKGIKHV